MVKGKTVQELEEEREKERQIAKAKEREKERQEIEKEKRPPRPKRVLLPPNEIKSEVSIFRLIFRFFRYHWRGLVGLLTPIIATYKYYPAKSNYDNVWLCAVIMIVYWVTECIPLQVTSFIPIALMPITRTMDTHPVCMCYLEDTIILYMAGIMLASAVEWSGLPKRIAFASFGFLGLQHWRILATLCFTTMFISMWITNTAATLIMMPIMESIIELYELQGEFKVYERTKNGDMVPSQLTICYYCSITFAASIGGIGTIFGTATNFVGKALFKNEFPEAPQLSILDFSCFSIPIMLVLNVCLYFYMAIIYLGMFRPFSKASKAIKLSEDALQHSRRLIRLELQKMGPISCYEYFVIVMILFSILMFCLRSPGHFPGWGDYLHETLRVRKGTILINDSAVGILICFIFILLPCPKKYRKLFKTSTGEPQDQIKDEMKERRSGQQTRLLVTWDHMTGQLPWSYIFVFGGAIALATSSREEFSNTNEEIVKLIKEKMDEWDPGSKTNGRLIPIVIIITVLATNFISNIIVAILGMLFVNNLAYYLRTTSLWYILAIQFSASFCFMLPFGTPGNYIVYKKAKLSIFAMMFAGIGPTIFSIILMWFSVVFYAPLIWPSLNQDGVPSWVNRTD